MNSFKLSDEAIGMVAKLLQIAMLTGTDIVDNLRLMELHENDGQLFVTEDFAKQIDKNVEEMLAFAKENDVNE